MSRDENEASKVTQMALPIPGVTLHPLTRRAARQPSRQTIVVPIESTFEPSQGIREVITASSGSQPVKVVLDARYLELAEQNMASSREPADAYIGNHGSIINLAVFLNLLRCTGALAKWHQDELGCPIVVNYIPPSANSKVRQLWNVLGIEQLLAELRQHSVSSRPAGKFEVFTYQSRYVSPIMRVTTENRHEMITRCHDWIAKIAGRLGAVLHRDLVVVVPEIITNLVKYGFAGGAFVISVWPNGQIELLWTNRVDHLADWPPEDTAKGLANGLLLDGRGGSGISYILDELLPRYAGIFAVNHRGNDVIFKRGRYIEIYGHGRRSETFLPRSVLFTLELFTAEARERK